MQCTKQDKNSWITGLSKVLSESQTYSLNGMTIYTFGSYATTPTGRDIDLLIVYDRQVVSLREALYVRKQIARRVVEQTGKQSHICLLARDEPESLVFIREENAEIIVNQAIDTGEPMSKKPSTKRIL